jgi:hypothetical protein
MERTYGPAESAVSAVSHQLRLRSKQLEHCVVRLRERIWQNNLSNALADAAEATEISRRLYSLLESFLRDPNS